MAKGDTENGVRKIMTLACDRCMGRDELLIGGISSLLHVVF